MVRPIPLENAHCYSGFSGFAAEYPCLLSGLLRLCDGGLRVEPRQTAHAHRHRAESVCDARRGQMINEALRSIFFNARHSGTTFRVRVCIHANAVESPRVVATSSGPAARHPRHPGLRAVRSRPTGARGGVRTRCAYTSVTRPRRGSHTQRRRLQPIHHPNPGMGRGMLRRAPAKTHPPTRTHTRRGVPARPAVHCECKRDPGWAGGALFPSARDHDIEVIRRVRLR